MIQATGLPDFFTEAEVHEDVPAYMHGLRARCPVYREPHHDVVMVTGYPQAMEVLSNKREDFSNCLTVTGPARARRGADRLIDWSGSPARRGGRKRRCRRATCR